MFKLGDAVTIRTLNDTERDKYPYYHEVILKYYGQIGELLKITEYDMLVKFSMDLFVVSKKMGCIRNTL